MKQNRRDGIDSGMAIMQPAAGTAYGREGLGEILVDGPAAHSLRGFFLVDGKRMLAVAAEGAVRLNEAG